MSTEAGKVLTLSSANFADATGSGIALVDFWAEWCGPCRAVAPVVERIAAEFADRIVVGKVNVDDEQELAAQFGIRSLPTLMILRGGAPVNTIVGATSAAALQEAIKDALSGG